MVTVKKNGEQPRQTVAGVGAETGVGAGTKAAVAIEKSAPDDKVRKVPQSPQSPQSTHPPHKPFIIQLDWEYLLETRGLPNTPAFAERAKQAACAPAVRVGWFAVFRAFRVTEDLVRDHLLHLKSPQYQVAHIPSGRVFLYGLRSREGALRYADELMAASEDRGIDWEFSQEEFEKAGEKQRGPIIKAVRDVLEKGREEGWAVGAETTAGTRTRTTKAGTGRE